MKKNKKLIRLYIFMIILMLIPIIKVYGNETDKYTCSTEIYEPVQYLDDPKIIVCCPIGFEYLLNKEVNSNYYGEKYCYAEAPDVHAYDYLKDDYQKELEWELNSSGTKYYFYIEPETAEIKEGQKGCFVCENHEKYVWSNTTTPDKDYCPTKWVAEDLNEQECKLRENNNTTNNDSEDGIYMVLQCGKEEPFFPSYFTDNSGNIFRSIFKKESYEDWVHWGLVPRCWLSNNGKTINEARCSNAEDKYVAENQEIFTKGICPIDIRASKDDSDERVPYGQAEPIKKAKLTDNKFIIYSYKYKNKTRITIEAYSAKEGLTRGKYGYIGGDLVETSDDEILYQQSQILRYMYGNDGSIDFFNIDNKFETLQIAGNGNWDKDIAVCDGKDIEKCKKDKEFKVLLISGDGKNFGAQENTIDKKVTNFFTSDAADGVGSIKAVFEQNEDYKKVLSDEDSEEFVNECKELNQDMNKNGIHKFSDYPLETMIDKLEVATYLIDELYKISDNIFNGKELLTATAEWIMEDTIGTKELLDVRYELGEEYSLNAANQAGAVYTSFIELIRKSLDGKTEANMYGFNLLTLQSDLDNYGGLFYETVNNLLSGQIELTIGQENRLNSIKDILDIIAEERNYTFAVVNCEGLLSQKLIDKINSYLNIVKYAIPILLIGLGTFDFTKALFAGDEDNMKKAQKTFIKRLSVAILFFFVPIIVNFILGLANKVWPIIIPNSCESKLKDK